jgi:prepilin-type N-terminal cleavage/methylation domain-containing protein
MKKGFTLIEGIMVILLVGVLSAVLSLYLREGLNAWRFLIGQKTLAITTRAASQRLARELKRINGAANLLILASTEVSFRDIESKTVTFESQGRHLLRNGDMLLDSLKYPGGLSFEYLDAQGNPTAEAASVRAVRCRLISQKDDNRFVLQSSARIRVRGAD